MDTKAPTGLGRRGRVTMRMIGDVAGVSASTVSYVLSGRNNGTENSGISPQTTDRVLQAALELNYRPNHAAKSIRTGRSDSVILSMTMLADPWALAVVDAVGAAVRQDGLSAMVLADGDWAETLQKQASDAAFIDHVDDAPQSLERLRHLAASGVRMVVYGEFLEPDGFDVIRPAASTGCRLAVDHLLQHHTKIACLTTQTHADDPGPSRVEAYRAAMSDAGLETPDSYFVVTGNSIASARDGARQLLSLPDPPTAIYCTTDYLGLSAIDAANELRLDVPGDVAIIGVGNTPAGLLSHPPLSTVGPKDTFGEIARLLRFRASEDERTPDQTIVLDWNLVLRSSSVS